MATAQQILADRHDPVAALGLDATALDAARLMNERHIGSVVVLDESSRLVGIFTERDVLRRVVADGRDPATTAVGEIMTSPVAVATPHTALDELRKVMREKRIRHVPVMDDDRLVGMISIGDLNRHEHDVDVETIRYLEQYISVP